MKDMILQVTISMSLHNKFIHILISGDYLLTLSFEHFTQKHCLEVLLGKWNLNISKIFAQSYKSSKTIKQIKILQKVDVLY